MTSRNEKLNVTGRTLGWKVILQAAQSARAAGDNQKAELLYEKVLNTVEKRLDPEDLRIGFVLAEMSDFFSDTGQAARGEDCFRRAREIMEHHADKLDNMTEHQPL